MNYPRLSLNEAIVNQNLNRIFRKASNNNLELRPHFKTHQSHTIGQWIKEAGVSGITVSSLEMADYFAQDGWKDITVAFPANSLQHKLIDSIAESCSLNLLIVSDAALRLLQNKITSIVGIYIEVDPGYGRSGVSVADTSTIKSLINTINEHSNTEFRGFYSHAGHSYSSRSTHEIKTMASDVLERLMYLKTAFPDAPICFGDTPSCSVLEEFGPATQLSPGNLVFYDWIQTKIGSCTPNDIAVMMECPIVEKYEERNQLLIHGGAVHFSKDYLEENGKKVFGVVARDWGKPLEENYICSLSQEHGIVQCTPSYFDSVSIGDVIKVYPIHSCLTANLMGKYYVDGTDESIDHFSKSYQRA